MKDPLFSPIVIGGLKIKNRIYMPAMHLNMCRNYLVSDQILAFYKERAAGGAGIITVGYASVDSMSANPLHIGAHDDDFIPGLSELSATIKANGARAAVQLNHAGRYNHSMLLGGVKPIAPSAIPSRLTGETPEEMDAEQIIEVISNFAAAAGRVKKAGFDAVEILCGTGYLISSFLSPLTNRRTDEFGGSLENRMRFGLEVINAVRAEVGAGFPLIVRVNGNDFVENGIHQEDLYSFVRHLEKSNVDAFCVNVGWHESRIPQIQTKVPRGVYAYLARNIRERVSVPVIASHRINDPMVARKILTDGSCDMVAMGRALIADPYLPEKARNGRDEEIVHCVACAQGCFDHIFQMRAVECLCNPRAGHEFEIEDNKSVDSKKVLVIGGGAAGMSAAMSAYSRGHHVTLVEQKDQLGGQLLLAGVPPGREEFTQLARDLVTQVENLGIEVRLNTMADSALLEYLKPDAVILATGGKPVAPPIAGCEMEHVVQAWDVLAGRVPIGENVVIVGGGAVGVETALMLAEEGTMDGESLKFLLVHGAADISELLHLATRGKHRVTIVEMINKLGANFGKTTRWTMLDDLKRFGVETRTKAKVRQIAEDSVEIECKGEIEKIPADTVVLAVGTHENSQLQREIEATGLSYQVIGDAQKPAMVFDAIHQGYAMGRNI